MAIAAPELAAIVAASRPAPAPSPAPAGGGAQVLFGLMLLGVGIFLAWLFATGRLKAVQTAIASGVAPTFTAPATNADGSLAATPNLATVGNTAPVSTALPTISIQAPAQAGGVGSAGVSYDPSTGSLTATPAFA